MFVVIYRNSILGYGESEEQVASSFRCFGALGLSRKRREDLRFQSLASYSYLSASL
ncbi:hypothetical protein PsWM33_05125 [Pseudovibrio sp. WM33]|nr:hypothetical protein PsWM33_05125 [Pseudovibrio sp. WM33]